MKIVLLVIFLVATVSGFAQEKTQNPKPDDAMPIAQPCVIVQHQARKWSDTGALTGKQMHPFAYVEGDYPAKFKWRSELSDKDVRELQQKGGKLVVLPTNYHAPDLEDARKQCKSQK